MPRASRRRHLIIALALAVLAMVGGACAGDSDGAIATSTTRAVTPTSADSRSGVSPGTVARGTTIEVEVTGGEVAGGPRREKVPLGEEVTLVVSSDATDEVHVHTYDFAADVAPGAPARVSFVADIPGVHEVELERAGTVLLTLQVG